MKRASPEHAFAQAQVATPFEDHYLITTLGAIGGLDRDLAK